MYFVTTEWPGGIYASPAALGSRPGAPLAASWAVMVMLGKEGPSTYFVTIGKFISL